MNFYELNTTGMSIEEVENALAYQDDELDAKIEELVNSVRFPVLLRGGTSCDSASEYEAHIRMLAAEQRAEILAEVATEIFNTLAADFEMTTDEFHQAMLVGGSIADGLSESEQHAINVYFGRS